jgi:hypothetical protein
MKLTLFLAAAAIAFGPATLNPCSSTAYAAEVGYRCCKVCKKGKACGDSCISRDKECHKGPGCACDG